MHISSEYEQNEKMKILDSTFKYGMMLGISLHCLSLLLFILIKYFVGVEFPDIVVKIITYSLNAVLVASMLSGVFGFIIYILSWIKFRKLPNNYDPVVSMLIIIFISIVFFISNHMYTAQLARSVPK